MVDQEQRDLGGNDMALVTMANGRFLSLLPPVVSGNHNKQAFENESSDDKHQPENVLFSEVVYFFSRNCQAYVLHESHPFHKHG